MKSNFLKVNMKKIVIILILTISIIALIMAINIKLRGSYNDANKYDNVKVTDDYDIKIVYGIDYTITSDAGGMDYMYIYKEDDGIYTYITTLIAYTIAGSSQEKVTEVGKFENVYELISFINNRFDEPDTNMISYGFSAIINEKPKKVITDIKELNEYLIETQS